MINNKRKDNKIKIKTIIIKQSLYEREDKIKQQKQKNKNFDYHQLSKFHGRL